MKNKLSAIILIAALMLGICTPMGDSRAASMSVGSAKLRIGAIYSLRTTGLYGTVKWKSSDKTVATVKNGIVSAVGTGSTTISATSGSKSVTCKITVKGISKKKGSKYNPKTLPKNKKKGLNFNFYMEEKKVGKFNIQIERFAYGEESARMAKNNTSNPTPGATQQYLFFTVRLKYVSGEQTIKMSNVFNYNNNIFGAYGAKQLKPINYGFAFGSNENMSTVTISPGNTRTADVAILVEKGFTPVTFRLQTGKKSYTWVKL